MSFVLLDALPGNVGQRVRVPSRLTFVGLVPIGLSHIAARLKIASAKISPQPTLPPPGDTLYFM